MCGLEFFSAQFFVEEKDIALNLFDGYLRDMEKSGSNLLFIVLLFVSEFAILESHVQECPCKDIFC